MHQIFVDWFQSNETSIKEQGGVIEVQYAEDSMGDSYECFLEKDERLVGLYVHGEKAGGGIIFYFNNKQEIKNVELRLENLLDELNKAKDFALG